ncbi:MAG: acyl carrier protein [Lachnospiraceae bacterium]
MENERVQTIIDVIADELNMDASEITMESAFANDLGADSLDVCQIIIRLEDTFEIQIEDDAVTNIVTVGDAIEQLEKVLG